MHAQMHPRIDKGLFPETLATLRANSSSTLGGQRRRGYLEGRTDLLPAYAFQ